MGAAGELPTRPMKLSVELPIASPDALMTCALAIEDAGFDACFVTDHPAPSREWFDTGGHETLDPFVALSFAAAATRRLRLHTNCLIPAYRNPYLSAKAVATLDACSCGRVILGVAVGYLEAEFEALGVPFDERARRLDWSLWEMKAAWAGELAGNIVTPRCVQQPHPPIWAGGNSSAAIRRAIEHGDGWSPFPASPRTAAAVDTASMTDMAMLANAIARFARAGRGGRPPGAARRLLHAVLASRAQGRRRPQGVRRGSARARCDRRDLARLPSARTERRGVLRHRRRVRRGGCRGRDVNSKIYIHEFIDIIGSNRARVHAPHDGELVSDRARRAQHALLRRLGNRRVDGTLARGRQHVGARRLGRARRQLRARADITVAPGPALAKWWAAAAELRRGGFDRVVVPEPWSPTIEELTSAGVSGVVYAHEVVTGTDRVGAGVPRHAGRGRRARRWNRSGLRCVGAYRVAMINDTEAIVIWALPSWEAWGHFEQAWDGSPLAAWRARLVTLNADVQRTLMVDVPLSPLRTGRQPQVEDRRPLDEL